MYMYARVCVHVIVDESKRVNAVEYVYVCTCLYARVCITLGYVYVCMKCMHVSMHVFAYTLL